MRDTEQRSISQALAIYLFWLRTGLDQFNIAAIFNIRSQQVVSNYLDQV